MTLLAGACSDTITDTNGDASPGPTPTQMELGGEEAPLIREFERQMLLFGRSVGNQQQFAERPDNPTSAEEEAYQETQYYDGLQAHQEVRNYVLENELSGDRVDSYMSNVEDYIAKSLEVVRDNYVLFHQGGNAVRDWRRFPKGLYFHYQDTEDQDSYDAVLLLRDGKTEGTGNPAGNSNFANASWIREMSYWLQAHTWAEKLDDSRDAGRVQKYVEYLENHLHQIRNGTSSQAFYMGLIGMALIEWYEHAGNEYWPAGNWATIPDALEDFYGWMIDQGPDGAKMLSGSRAGDPFWIEDYNDSGTGMFYSSMGGSAPYTEVQNLITPIYYWIGMYRNDHEFIKLGDKVFAGAVTHSSPGSPKAFGQHVYIAVQGLRWRQKYIDSN